MRTSRLSRRALLRSAMVGGAGLALAACQPKVVEVEKIVERTVEVEKQVEVEKVVKETVVVEKEVQAASDQVTVRYHCRAGAVQAPASEYPTHQNRLSEFREEHPEINVEREEIAGTNEEYYVKLATMYVGGTLGDMTFTSQTYQQHLKLAYDGVLAPCDEFMERDGISDDEWFPAAMVNSRLDGKLYGLPMCLHPGGAAFLIHNLDMWEGAGLEAPDGETYTIDKLREAAIKLSQGDPDARTTYGWRPNFNGDAQCHEAWMRMFGAESFIDREGRQSLMNTQEALEWAKYAYAIFNEDKVAPRAEAIPEAGELAMFAAGNLASFQTGTWNLKNSLTVVADAFKVGLQMFPIGPGGYGPCGYLNSFAPTSVSKHLDEAWKLTYAFCDKRCGYLQIKLSGSMPGRPDVFDEPDIQNDDIAMLAFEATRRAGPQYFMYNFAALEHQQAFRAAVDKIILGEVEPTQTYMDSVYDILQKILDKPR